MQKPLLPEVLICQSLVAYVTTNWNLILSELSLWMQLDREATGLVYSTAGD